MRVVALVQARMGSTRLPNKVMKEIIGKPMIQLLLERLSKSKEIDEIVIASSIDKKNDTLDTFVSDLGYVCSRGSENDVLSRFYSAAKESCADVVVRITGDCPLVDSNLVDQVIQKYKSEGLSIALYIKLLILGAVAVIPGIILVSLASGFISRGCLVL